MMCRNERKKRWPICAQQKGCKAIRFDKYSEHSVNHTSSTAFTNDRVDENSYSYAGLLSGTWVGLALLDLFGGG